MKLVRVGAVALNQTPLDWEGNTRRIREALRHARDAEVDVLCLPELCLTGYGCEDMFHAGWVTNRASELLAELLPLTAGMAVSIGLPVAFRNAVFNAVALCVDGELVGVVAKQFLASDGIHYEPRWFEPWTAEAVSEIRLAGRTVPMGDLVFDVGGVRVAFEICEDAWVAERPGARHALDAVDILLNPSASHFAFGKLETRERFVVEGSRAFSLTYVYANLMGNEAGRAIYDGGALIAHDGALVAQGPRLSFQEVSLTHVVVDVEASRMSSSRTRSFHPDLADDPTRTIVVPHDWAPRGPDATGPGLTTKLDAVGQEEEFVRAEALALFDYLRKSRSRGFVVSLSGGADSAAVATLVSAAVRLAVADVGLDGVRERLGYMGLTGETPDALVRQLLVTVYQGTEHSSTVTRHAARAVALGVSSTHHEIEVGVLVDTYESLVGGALGLELSWTDHDIARQNIQARARAPGVWMIANIRGALLLSTSNRSEAAVGYATMDVDTAGGLSPVAGVDKAFLRRWLRWMEHTGLPELGVVPELAAVNAQQPTAELRPADMGQTDEGDLMPYSVLEAIEEEAIGRRRSPIEVFELLRVRLPEVGPVQLGAWIARFYRLWSRNQWKRERYAPSFHLDDRNLDPRSWCRFPILSSGFAAELAALDVEVAKWR
jgi:NAD+ synthase (glutamine-hydrolysing)